MKRQIMVGWLALGLMAFGNGGGYFRGGVEGTGDVAGFVPKETQKVRILDEKLTVVLGPNEAQVEVRYLMKNVSNRKAKVRFGFPVEESLGRSEPWEGPAEVADRNKAKLSYCKNYRIEVGGEELKTNWEGESRPAVDLRFDRIAGWLISEMKFKAGEEKELRIRFDSVYPKESSFVSRRSYLGAATFRYRLSTGAVWAGTIGKGRVELIPAGLPADYPVVVKPVNRFKKIGEKWVWEFEDLEPNLADDLVVMVKPSVKMIEQSLGDNWDGPTVTYVESDGKWQMRHSNFKVKASSTLPGEGDLSYGAENIKGGSANDAWSEGSKGAGVGEWLELEPEVAKPLVAISMVPGYSKGEGLFKANARPRKMTVELNGEHRFSVNVADLNEMMEFSVTGYDKPVSKIRITFDEVWAGEKFEDLCVSYIGLHVQLDKKPKIQPSR